MTSTFSLASITRALLRAAPLLFVLSFVGADGCHAWWDDYQPPSKGNTCTTYCCPAGQTYWLCRCRLTTDWSGTCKTDPAIQCGISAADAQQTMARQEETAYSLARGNAKATCGCVDPDNVPPGFDAPGLDPETVGGDPAPQCSDDFFMGAGGGPSTSCGQSGDLCDVNTDCCSGSCSLNSCN